MENASLGHSLAVLNYKCLSFIKRRWAWLFSLALSAFAFCMVVWAIDDSRLAYHVFSKDTVHSIDRSTGFLDNPTALALLHRSRILWYLSLPVAAASICCLSLSHRRKEPSMWRWTVVAVLVEYFWFLLGPI